MRKITLFIVVAIMFLANSFACSGFDLASAPPASINGNYPLKIGTSMKFKTIVYGNPFGDFLIDKEDGWMENEQKIKGEYQYLGYNYEEEKITNDRYFSKLDRRGNVFDQNYTGIEWQKVTGALLSWDSIINNLPLRNYMLTTNFYDDDHPTEGQTDTGFNLLKLFKIPEGSDDYSEIYRKAKVLTTPETGSAYIY